jgi:Transposase DDE domain
LKAEVAELLARAEAADQADVADGMSIPEELARREERLAKLAEARAKLEARAKEPFEREMAEHRAKLAARDEKTAASGKKPGGRTPAPPITPRWTTFSELLRHTRTLTPYFFSKAATRPEPVFGIIKSVMGFRQFLLRGLDCVRGEWSLVTMAWSIKRMHALSLG